MTRRATIRTTHDDPELVARALRPDDTAEMETTVDGDAVVTRIERESSSGLHATVDDYVVNLGVAVDVATAARPGRPASRSEQRGARPDGAETRTEQRERPADAGTASDSDSDDTNTNE